MADATQTTDDVRTTVDLNFGPRVIEKTIPYKGTTVGLHYYQATRAMRNRAMLEAIDVYKMEHPNFKDGEGMGGDPTILEKEMACRMIKWWSLPRPPREMWDWLPVDLGDLIVEALEIGELFAFSSDKDHSGRTMGLAKEAEAAKN